MDIGTYIEYISEVIKEINNQSKMSDSFILFEL